MPAQQYPEPTVGALILNPAGELFLMRSHKWRDRYTVPGGHIELGESMVQALRREVREETGLAIRDIELLCVQEFIYDEIFWQPSHFIFFDFLCRTDATEVTLNEEGESYIWAPLDEMPERLVDAYTARAIQACRRRLAGQKHVEAHFSERR